MKASTSAVKLAAAFTTPRVRKPRIRVRAFFMVATSDELSVESCPALVALGVAGAAADIAARHRGLAARNGRSGRRLGAGARFFLLRTLHASLHEVIADQQLEDELALHVLAAAADLGELLLDPRGVLLRKRVRAAQALVLGLVGDLARLEEGLLGGLVVLAERPIGLDLPALLVGDLRVGEASFFCGPDPLFLRGLRGLGARALLGLESGAGFRQLALRLGARRALGRELLGRIGLVVVVQRREVGIDVVAVRASAVRLVGRLRAIAAGTGTGIGIVVRRRGVAEGEVGSEQLEDEHGLDGLGAEVLERDGRSEER